MKDGSGSVSFPARKWRQRDREQREHESQNPQKAMSLENPQQETPSDKLYRDIVAEWMAASPVWTTGRDTALEIEKLKNQSAGNSDDISSLYLEMDVQSETIINLQRQLSEMKKEIQELKSQLKVNKESEGTETITKEIDEFRSLFGLPPLSDDFEKVSFGDLEGILNDLSENGLDSVEVIRSIRG